MDETVGEAGPIPTADAAERYLDLMKRCLTRLAFPERLRELPPGRRSKVLGTALRPLLAATHLTLAERVDVDLEARKTGRDWPPEAETMIGLRRLDNLQDCIGSVIADGVPGDLIETGVWRGGASIFMRAVLAAYGDETRTVWVADSFSGLPPPDPAYPVDAGDRHHTRSQLAISLEEVKENFRRYDLLDERVRFLEGWFKDTLPGAPIDRLAVVRLDGDMYGSTIEALEALYPKLSPGGYVIVDDYGLRGARAAVDDFRRRPRHRRPDRRDRLDGRLLAALGLSRLRWRARAIAGGPPRWPSEAAARTARASAGRPAGSVAPSRRS